VVPVGIVKYSILEKQESARKTLFDLVVALVFVLMFMAVLARVGLVAAAGFLVVWRTLYTSPPLDTTQWYGGRAALALLVPLALLLIGFYVSVGGQPIFGNLLKEE